MPVGFPTKVNYATGDVLSATNMNDLSGTVNLLDGTQYSGGKNRVLNSNFSVWQRGTSFVPTTTSYSADRWQAYRGTTGSTVTRQVTGDTTNLPNIQYCARVSRDSGNTSTQDIYLSQAFESVNSIPLAGKTVTLSFYARKGANFSGSNNSQLNVNLYTGTGTDQNVLTGYTGSAQPITQGQIITTTWTRYSFTGTVATTATELQVLFGFTPNGTAGAADYYEITGVQLEASTVASAYAPNGATYQAELAACQRYYYRRGGTSVNGPYTPMAQGIASSSSAADLSLFFPVSMRIAPTAVESSATVSWLALWDGSALIALNAAPTIPGGGNGPDGVRLTVATAATLTSFRFYSLVTNNAATGFLAFSAEL